MKSHYRAIVIGGGVVGCSVLYHLARAGWSDILLIERSELTSGSSWHAAGGFHTLNGDPNVARLQAYTVQLYKELEEVSGQSCSLHLTGGVMMADSPERMDFLRLAHAKGRYLGMETELITPSEAKAMFPLMDETKFVGAMWDPVEGHLDPSGTTHAYAKAARKLGAEIALRNRVVELTQDADGTWNVVTEQGTVKAEHVVNCGGLWAREVGRMVGVELPVLAMEHMYLLTEPMPEVEAFNRDTGREIIGVLDFKGEIYMRQERNGMLLGTYEKACKPWSPVNTPWNFGHELLQPDLDRIRDTVRMFHWELEFPDVFFNEDGSLKTNPGFDAILGKEYHGHVVEVAQTGTPLQGVVNFKVTVELTDVDHLVKPGMTAAVNIVVKEMQDVLLVPNRAVRLVDGERVVYLLAENQPVKTEIRLGPSSDTTSVIAGGELKEGDIVILNPPMDFGPGGPFGR